MLIDPKTFMPQLAYVPDSGTGVPLIAKGATLDVHATSDTARLYPLQVFDLSGAPIVLKSNNDGVIPWFLTDGFDDVVWRSGTLEAGLVCRDGITGAPGPAGPSWGGVLVQSSPPDPEGDAQTDEDHDAFVASQVDQPQTAAALSATYATKADATIQDTTERILTFPTQTGGRIACRRWGPMVEYNIYDVTFSDPATSVLTIDGFFPPGFRPMYSFMYDILADGVKVRIENDGQLLLYGHTTSKYYRGSPTFMTNDAFPDPLPGTPP